MRGLEPLKADPTPEYVLFDPERIEDTATFEHPVATPVGIAAVFVNGNIVAGDSL